MPKKSGGSRPILDLRVSISALQKLSFKMLTQKRVFECIRPLNWFAAIDLKEALVSCLNPPAALGIPAIRVRGLGMSVPAPAFRAPQPVGFSGQLGKEQTRADAEDLFFSTWR